MSVTAGKHGDDSSAWLRREAIVERFEQQWRAAGDADIADFLNGDYGDRATLLLELVKVDLEYRW